MRTVIISVEAKNQLKELTAYGLKDFEAATIKAKRTLLSSALEALALMPERHPIDQAIGYRKMPIKKTPYIVVYGFTDDELQIKQILRRGQRYK